MLDPSRTCQVHLWWHCRSSQQRVLENFIGQMGTVMGDETAAIPPCTESWVQCRMGGKPRLQPVVSAEPQDQVTAQQPGVFRLFLHSDTVQWCNRDRQAKVQGSQNSPGCLLLSSYHTSAKKSLNFITLPVCGSYWQFGLYYSVY